MNSGLPTTAENFARRQNVYAQNCSVTMGVPPINAQESAASALKVQGSELCCVSELAEKA